MSSEVLIIVNGAGSASPLATLMPELEAGTGAGAWAQRWARDARVLRTLLELTATERAPHHERLQALVYTLLHSTRTKYKYLR